MKKSQSGFSLVEVIIVVVVLGLLLGLGGLYYVQTQSAKSEADAAAAAATTKTPEPGTVSVNASHPDLKTVTQYNKKDLGFTFIYPANWKVVEESTAAEKTVYLRSPDYAAQSGGRGFTGSEIAISRNTTSGTFELQKKDPATKEIKDTQVGGKKAFSYTLIDNEFGDYAIGVAVDLGDKGSAQIAYQSFTAESPKINDYDDVAVFYKVRDTAQF